MRLPWSEWPPRRKAKVLLAIFLTFVLGLLVYDNVDRHLYFTLRHAIYATGGSIRFKKATLTTDPLTGQSVLNVTLSFQNPTGINLTLLSLSAKLLDWYLFEKRQHGVHASFTELGAIRLSMRKIPGYSTVYFTFQLPLSVENLEIIEGSGFKIRPSLYGSVYFEGSYFYKKLKDGVDYIIDHLFEPLPFLDVKVESPAFERLEQARASLRQHGDELGLRSCYIDAEKWMLIVLVENFTVEVEQKIRKIVGTGVDMKVVDKETFMKELYEAKARVVEHSEELKVATTLDKTPVCYVDCSGYLVVGVRKNTPDSEISIIRSRIRELIGEDLPLLVFKTKY
ncbi:MAG: hypothetical protein DRO12_05850 [Thermoprotei archaeon]|nr:MAG: hypothetical protein DRO12_05850 [Thermoprotei archaeon]